MNREARRRCSCRRAERASTRTDDDIVAQKLERDWQEGCLWAAVAVTLTFGPMLAWGIYWGWL